MLGGDGGIVIDRVAEGNIGGRIRDCSGGTGPAARLNDLELVSGISCQVHGQIAYSISSCVALELIGAGIPAVEGSNQEGIGCQNIDTGNSVKAGVPGIGLHIVVLAVLEYQVSSLGAAAVIKDTVTVFLVQGDLVDVRAVGSNGLGLGHGCTGPGSSGIAAGVPGVGIDFGPVCGVDHIDGEVCDLRSAAGNICQVCVPGVGLDIVVLVGMEGQVASLSACAAVVEDDVLIGLVEHDAVDLSAIIGSHAGSGHSHAGPGSHGRAAVIPGIGADSFPAGGIEHVDDLGISNSQSVAVHIVSKHILTGCGGSNGSVSAVGFAESNAGGVAGNSGGGAGPGAAVNDLELIGGIGLQAQGDVTHSIAGSIDLEAVCGGVPTVEGACQIHIGSQILCGGDVLQLFIPGVGLQVKILTALELVVGSLHAAAVIEDNVLKGIPNIDDIDIGAIGSNLVGLGHAGAGPQSSLRAVCTPHIGSDLGPVGGVDAVNGVLLDHGRCYVGNVSGIFVPLGSSAVKVLACVELQVGSLCALAVVVEDHVLIGLIEGDAVDICTVAGDFIGLGHGEARPGCSLHTAVGPGIGADFFPIQGIDVEDGCFLSRGAAVSRDFLQIGIPSAHLDLVDVTGTHFQVGSLCALVIVVEDDIVIFLIKLDGIDLSAVGGDQVCFGHRNTGPGCLFSAVVGPDIGTNLRPAAGVDKVDRVCIQNSLGLSLFRLSLLRLGGGLHRLGGSSFGGLRLACGGLRASCHRQTQGCDQQHSQQAHPHLGISLHIFSSYTFHITMGIKVAHYYTTSTFQVQ